MLPEISAHLPEEDRPDTKPHRYMWSGLQRMVAEYLPYETKALHDRMKALELPVDGFEWHEAERVRSMMHVVPRVDPTPRRSGERYESHVAPQSHMPKERGGDDE